jgi:hypothetical protein
MVIGKQHLGEQGSWQEHCIPLHYFIISTCGLGVLQGESCNSPASQVYLFANASAIQQRDACSAHSFCQSSTSACAPQVSPVAFCLQRKLEERSDSVAEKRGLAEEDSSKALSQADSRTHSDNEVVGVIAVGAAVLQGLGLRTASCTAPCQSVSTLALKRALCTLPGCADTMLTVVYLCTSPFVSYCLAPCCMGAPGGGPQLLTVPHMLCVHPHPTRTPHCCASHCSPSLQVSAAHHRSGHGASRLRPDGAEDEDRGGRWRPQPGEKLRLLEREIASRGQGEAGKGGAPAPAAGRAPRGAWREVPPPREEVGFWWYCKQG